MASAPIVSVWCWHRVGSADERPGLTGISHWLEHMNFKGTRRFTKEQIRKMMRDAGLERIKFGSGIPYWCAVGYKS